MQKFLYWLLDAFKSVLSLLRGITFSFGNVQVSFLSLLLSLFIICFVVSVFWKGAQR